MNLTIEEALRRAVEAHRAGQLQDADRLYTAILKVQPDNPDANHNLGILAVGVGKVEQALPFLKAALESNPGVGQYWNSYVKTLIQAGQTREAKAILQRADQAGVAVPELDLLKSAIEANVAGKPEGGKLAAASADPKAQVDALLALYNQGEYQAVVEQAQRLLPSFPGPLVLFNLLGAAHSQLEQYSRAIECYSSAIGINPDFAEGYNNLGVAYDKQGDVDAAIVQYQHAIRLKPQFCEAHNNMGTALKSKGDLDSAAASFMKAVEIKPDYAQAHYNLANCLEALGSLDAARQHYGRALALNPDFAECHRSLASLLSYDGNEAQVRQMLSLHSRNNLADIDRMHVCYALAKVFEDKQDYQSAFDFYRQANALRARQLNYNPESDRLLFSRIRSIFQSGAPAGLPVLPAPVVADKKLIFVLGMPRSGTTLVEQILSSHSDIFGAGELDLASKAVRAARLLEDPLSGANLAIFRNSYLSGIAGLKTDKGYVVDKMPLNFRWIGFILSAFPDASIVHIKRDPMATCWSIYKHYFSEIGNRYAYDMGHLTSFFRLYTDLMQFWHQQFPGAIYDLHYEALTEDQSVETRKLISRIGVNWEQQCLDFHRNRRAVRTASSAQVRQKMYTGSSLEWRKYEPYLDQMLQGLAELSA